VSCNRLPKDGSKVEQRPWGIRPHGMTVAEKGRVVKLRKYIN